MPEDNFVNNTDREVNAWKIAGWTLPFIAMAGMLVCSLYFSDWITIYAVTVIVIWVAVSVAWWWWALHKILRIARLLLSTNNTFVEVQQEIKSLKEDVSDRKRRKQKKD